MKNEMNDEEKQFQRMNKEYKETVKKEEEKTILKVLKDIFDKDKMDKDKLKEKWSVLLNSTTDSDCRAMMIEPMETKIAKPQIKTNECDETNENNL